MIDRREALRRAALLLGGALAAPTVAGVLAGCEARRVPDGAWKPRALTPDQANLVATIADHILYGRLDATQSLARITSV